MKKWLALLCTLIMLPTLALADDLAGCPTASAVVDAAEEIYVTAPFSGTLETFRWAMGDTVQAGDTLFAYQTTPVYAPFDGKVSALFAREGDDASAATARYGMIAAIEPENPYLIQATTTGAYDKSDNKFIHPGETLYYKSSNNSRIKGSGRVISVSAEGYVVEVLTGEPEIAESVSLYRDSDYIKESNVGKGRCAAAAPIPVTGTGRVYQCHVQEGDSVHAGDLLFELLAYDAAPNASNSIVMGRKAAILALNCLPGQQVYKGQLLAALYDPSQLVLTALVDEVDIASLATGGKVSLILDCQPDTVYEATITAISQVGIQKQNACYYEVTLTLPQVNTLRLGMNATVYLNK